MEKVELKREFSESDDRDFDDVLDHSFFSLDELEDIEEDESNYETTDSEFRSISDL